MATPDCIVNHAAARVSLGPTATRSVLVPASTTILGKWNWYPPSWLGWLPKVNIEGHAHPPAPASGHRPALSEGAAD
jgi:RND superfamily putative drug exporter